MTLAALPDMADPKARPLWPSDDQVREPADQEFTDDGRKLNDAERVGGLAPDADPEQPVRRPQRPPAR
jgi:hypothetical protein